MIGEAYEPIKNTPPDGGKSALWTDPFSPMPGSRAFAAKAAGEGVLKVDVIDPAATSIGVAIAQKEWHEFGLTSEQVAPAPRKHGHYFKDVSRLQTVDVYRVLSLFGVVDPCIQHAVKKLLVAGGRGAKHMEQDVGEAIDALKRWQEMRAEDACE